MLKKNAFEQFFICPDDFYLSRFSSIGGTVVFLLPYSLKQRNVDISLFVGIAIIIYNSSTAHDITIRPTECAFQTKAFNKL